MAEKIGYQDGIAGFVGYMRKIPGVRYRDPDVRPDSLEQWSWLEKLERTLRILKDTHDAAVTEPDPPPAPPPPPPPPPPTQLVAPRTYNKVLPNGSDARFCTTGLPYVTDSQGRTLRTDVYSGYDDNGLDVRGGRSTDTQVPGLRPSNSMDGRGACDPYLNFPPWPVESYSR